MSVLLDARATRRMSVGMKAYVRELAERLPRVAPEIDLRLFSNGENFTLDEQLGLPAQSRSSDLVHFPTIFAPLMLPRRYVLTVHDLIHLQYPELFRSRTAAFYRLVVRRLARGATRIVVGDRRTVAACERYLDVDASLVRVVPLGYEPGLVDIEAFAAPRPYLLYAGNHRAHKNLRTLFDAWRGLAPGTELDLYLTGDDDCGEPGGSGVAYLGHLTSERLAGMIRGAAALVQPSLAEGYGLPILEALVRGTPVIASETSVPTDLAPYVATFAARDAGALRSLLEEVARAPERLRRCAAEGEAVARAYTWDRFASSTASVYREALEESLN